MSPAARGLVLAAAGLLAAALALRLLLGGPDPRLGAAATGLDGLHHWLSANGVAAQRFSGGYPLDAAGIALRVLPLYDPDPGTQRRRPSTAGEVARLETERDLSWRVVTRKTATAPTLIVLPKWRAGARLTGRVHPDLLIPDASLRATVARLAGPAARLSTDTGAGFTSRSVAHGGARHDVTLYAPRTIRAPGCVPVLGPARAALIVRCPLDGPGPRSEVLILSDPDLLNNHGLTLGGNAALVAALLPALAPDPAPGAAIWIDYSDAVWTRTAPPPAPEPRSWADLARAVAWPYTTIWAAFAVAVALAVWRGAVRDRPPRDEGRHGPASSLAAEARLMRLSGQAGRLAADYAEARRADLARRLLGRQGGPDALRQAAARRDPAAAQRFLSAADAMTRSPATLPAARALSRARTLDDIAERLTDGLD